MKSTRTQPLKLTLHDGTKVRTSDDVAYLWRTHGHHTGWSRTHRPDRHPQLPLLLIPKDFERERSRVLLDSEPADLRGANLAGAILITAEANHPEEIDQLNTLRNLRIAHEPVELNDVTIARATPEELKDLIGEHGLHVAARAFQLKSLPVREALISTLDPDDVATILADHPEIPAEIVAQTKRSAGYSPARVIPDDLPALAGNPNLPGRAQSALVRLLTLPAIEGDEDAAAALRRTLASPTLPEEAAWTVVQYNPLPRNVALALANNEHATWNWLRTILDGHTDPEVAIASRKVGEWTEARRARFAEHPDPEVRTCTGSPAAPAKFSWLNKQHLNVLQAVDDPISYTTWSQRPADVEPDEWGAYAVARQWAARADEFPEAEKMLRRAVNLHNRSWGALGQGNGDPQRAARAEAERVVALSDPQLRLPGLNPAETYSIEQARVKAVQATAAMGRPAPGADLDPITAAVLTACAAEANLV